MKSVIKELVWWLGIIVVSSVLVAFFFPTTVYLKASPYMTIGYENIGCFGLHKFLSPISKKLTLYIVFYPEVPKDKRKDFLGYDYEIKDKYFNKTLAKGEFKGVRPKKISLLAGELVDGKEKWLISRDLEINITFKLKDGEIKAKGENVSFLEKTIAPLRVLPSVLVARG